MFLFVFVSASVFKNKQFTKKNIKSYFYTKSFSTANYGYYNIFKAYWYKILLKGWVICTDLFFE